MTEFKQIIGRGTRVHEDTQEVLLHADRLPRRHQPLRRPGLRRRAGADLRAGRRRSHRAARRRAARRRRRRDAPAEARRRTRRSSMARRPTSASRPAADKPQQGLRRRRRRPRIIAERVEYLDENGKLVTESLRDFTKKALKKRFASLDDFLQPLEGGRAQAGDHRGAGRRGPAARPARRGGGQGPRPLRPHLPRRLRPPAAHPPRARRERPQARRLHQVRPAGARRARRAAREVPGRGRPQPRRPARPADPALRRDGHAAPAHQGSSAARADFEHAVHELQAALYQEAA